MQSKSGERLEPFKLLDRRNKIVSLPYHEPKVGSSISYTVNGLVVRKFRVDNVWFAEIDESR